MATLLTNDGKARFSTTEADATKRWFIMRSGLPRAQFDNWIRSQAEYRTYADIAREIVKVSQTWAMLSTVQRWVSHWVRDAQQELDQASIWPSWRRGS